MVRAWTVKIMSKPMPKIYLLLLTLLASLCFAVIGHSAGGDIAWQYDVAAVNKQEAKASAVDSQGNMVIVGYSEGAGNDFQVVKIKADGSAPLWTVSHDSTGGPDVATAVVIDSNDDVIVTGYVWNGATYSDIYTVKYAAADGAVLWQHTFDGTANGNDYATAITVDSINNVYVGGYMQDANDKDSFILLKFGPIDGPNPDGTPLWQASYNSVFDGHDRIYAIAAGVDGVAVTGESQNATPDFDCFTIKYGLDGSEIWQRRYSDTGNGKGQSVAMDAVGNVVMAGYSSNGSDSDFYVVKYAADDSPAKWVDIYDSGYPDEASDLWIDSLGDVYVTGTHATLETGEDVYIAKYEGVSGVEEWSSSYNSFNGDNDHGHFIVGDNDGELFVSGFNNDTASGFDDFLLLKVTRAAGTLLWAREYDGAGKHDRGVGAGLTAAGDLLVGGWSDRWTSGSSDYDFYALKYESGALNQPTSLTAITKTENQIDLAWVPNSATEENFIVERKTGAAGSYAVIATLGAAVDSYSDTGLAADTRYYYRVAAYNTADGHSPWSNEDNAKTTVVNYEAPALQYQFAGTGAGDDYAQAIAVGSDNHPVVTGSITGTGTGFDYATIKLDRSDLSVQWKAEYNDGDNEGDVANALTVDSSNRVVVTGYSSLYGGGAGNTNDVYTIGYPADGSVESWTDQYNGPDGNDDRSSAVASAVDGSDNTVVVGFGKNDSFNDDIYVIKYQADGTRSWDATPYDGGADDYPAAVAYDFAGDILVGGFTNNGSNKDFFVAKYSGSDGSQSWLKTFNGAGNGDDYINAIAVDAAGDIYVTGYSVNASGNGDLYTIKYAGNDGGLVWERGFNGLGDDYDVGEAIQFDPVDGSIMVGGTTNVAVGNHDYHLIRYDVAGNLLWQKTLDRPSSNEALYAMSIDLSGTVCLTGTTDIGGNEDVLTVKYDNDGNIFGASVYNGSANDDDIPAAVVANSYGETFVAGYTINASGDNDYMVFLADGESMQPPSPLTAVQRYTQVDLSWADNSLDELGFRLERKVGSCESENSWNSLYTASPGEVSHSDLNLSIGSTFCYRVQSYNGSGESSRWVELEASTVVPLDPSGLTGTVLNTTSIKLDWTDNTTSEEGFVVERCLVGAECNFSIIESSVAGVVTGTGAVTYTDSSVCPGQTYRYRVQSFQGGKWATDYSTVAVDLTTDSPVAPSSLSATRISEVQINLSWPDNSDDESSFKIERCVGSGCENFAEIASVAANTVSYSNTGLERDTLYRYRVTPYKTATCTVPAAYSPIGEATTSLLSPNGLTGYATPRITAMLFWTDNTVSEDGFNIERCAGSGCSDFVPLAVTSANDTRYVDDSICSGVVYRYQVRAYKNAGWDSDYSSPVELTAVAPPLPIGLSADGVSEVGIDLNWSVPGYDLSGYQIDRCQGPSCTPVAQLDDISAGPVLAMLMEEKSWNSTAGEVKDSSGNGNHGTSVNGAAVAKYGKYGWAGWFDGTDDYVSTSLILDQTADGPGATFEAWVYPTINSNTDRGVIGTHAGSFQWSLYRYGSQWRIYNGSGAWTNAGNVSLNAWQHLVVVFEPGVGVRFYKDGAMSSNATITYDSSSNPVFIGKLGTSSRYFSGKMDEVMVYDRALSHAEALARYNSGDSRNGTLTVNYNDSGLTPSTTYGYHLRSYANDECATSSPVLSSDTAVVYATTQSPPPPTGLWASEINTTQINLGWTDKTDSETGFVIERCIVDIGIACDADNQFSPLTTTADDVVSYADATVCAGQTYRYRVAAKNTDAPWQTIWTASAQATTDSVPTPTNFEADPISEVQINLSWDDSLVDVDSYTLERRCDAPAENCVDNDYQPLVQYGHWQLLDEATFWLKMDESVWGTPVNSVAGGSTINRYGAITVNDAERGRVGQFDGDNDYVYVYNYAGIDPTAEVSVSIWAKSATSSWDSSNSLMAKRYKYRFGPTGTGGMQFSIYDSGWKTLSVADLGIDITQWHHYTATFDGTELLIYVDGVQVGQLSYSGAIYSYDGSLYIGKDAHTNIYLNGWLDDAVIFTRALGAAEVDALYNLGNGATYQDTGLAPSTTYSYRLLAGKSGTCSWEDVLADNWVVLQTATLDPPAPTGLTVSQIDTTTLDLTWIDNSGSESAYHLQRCEVTTDPVVNCEVDGQFGTIAAALAADTVSYTDTEVKQGTTYHYRVRAEKSDGPNWETTWAGPEARATKAKATPFNLTATLISEVQINLAWNDNNSDRTGFKLDRCTVADCSSVDATFTLGAGTTSYQDSQLDPQTNYYYRVKAYKTATWSWDSAYTAIISKTTDVAFPVDLLADAKNTTRIGLTWSDVTASETSTGVERCEETTDPVVACDAANQFSPHVEVGANIASYTDNSVCATTTYHYRLKVKNEGLSFGAGACWTRKESLSFTNFVAGGMTTVEVPHAEGMQPGFEDVRFYDETAKRELKFGIYQLAEDGSEATYLVELGSNPTVSMYYGNADATYSGSLEPFTEFFDDFQGTSIDTSKWEKIDPKNAISQNNDLLLANVSYGWDTALISKATFTRQSAKVILVDLSIPVDNPARDDHMMIGWELNQTANPSYNQLVHGLFLQNYGFNVYEKGTPVGATGTYAANADYKMMIVLKNVGAKYYVRDAAYGSSWTLVQETYTHTDATMRIAFTQNSHGMKIHSVMVLKPTIDAGATLNSADSSVCYAFANVWDGYSNQNEATSNTPVAPSNLGVTALSDTEFFLNWADNTSDETGFRIERCIDKDCNDFSQIATVGAGQTSYSDTTDPSLIERSYRVRAYKESFCPWTTGYSTKNNTLPLPTAASNLTATALNSRMIQLDWDENASDETGYEVEVQLWNGRFTNIAVLGENADSFVDARSIQGGTSYTYRVRPFRDLDMSLYSTEASVTTPAHVDGDGPCL